MWTKRNTRADIYGRPGIRHSPAAQKKTARESFGRWERHRQGLMNQMWQRRMAGLPVSATGAATSMMQYQQQQPYQAPEMRRDAPQEPPTFQQHYQSFRQLEPQQPMTERQWDYATEMQKQQLINQGRIGEAQVAGEYGLRGRGITARGGIEEAKIEEGWRTKRLDAEGRELEQKQTQKTEYLDSLQNALGAVKQGATPEDIFTKLAFSYPNFSSDLKNIFSSIMPKQTKEVGIKPWWAENITEKEIADYIKTRLNTDGAMSLLMTIIQRGQ